MPRIFATAIASVLFSATVALPQVVETSSERFTRSAPDAGGQSIDFQNYGPAILGDFDDLNDQSLTVGASTGIGTAEQHSTIAPSNYAATLDTFASVSPDFFDVVNGFAESYFEVTFTIASSTTFTIDGVASAFGNVNGETSDVTIEILNAADGTTLATVIDLNDGIESFDVSDTLTPGEYTLRARVLSVVSRTFDDTPGSAFSNLQLAMTFDEAPNATRGDMDCNSAVNYDDIAPFVMALLDPDGYDAMFPTCDKNRADMNQDSLRNGEDIALLITEILQP